MTNPLPIVSLVMAGLSRREIANRMQLGLRDVRSRINYAVKVGQLAAEGLPARASRVVQPRVLEPNTLPKIGSPQRREILTRMLAARYQASPLGDSLSAT